MPPMNLHLEHTNGTHSNFSWDPILPSCPPLSYIVHTKNCGTCPRSIDSATVLCEDFELSTEIHVCSIAVQTRCNDVIGRMSDILQVTLNGNSDPINYLTH